jgi:peptide/nickel transport system substrate-binding protein
VELFWKYACVLVTVALCGCTSVDNKVEKNNHAGSVPDAAQIFRMNLTVSPASLDPAQARDQAMVWMTSQLFNGLVALDDSLRIVPAIAKQWRISRDGLTYTFALRTDVRFHKSPVFGPQQTRTVTAHDVAYSFTRICNRQTASPGQWVFNDKVAGVADYQQGKAAVVAGFEVVNDSIFCIRLVKPFAPFLSLLTMPYAFVVPREAVEAYGRGFRQKPVGTGPFMLKSWAERQQLVLRANPHYFENGLPKLRAVVVRFIPSRLTAFNELLRGNLDFVEGLDAALKDEVLTPEGTLNPKYTGRVQLATSAQLTTEYLGCLTRDSLHPRNPLLDARIRRAVAHAIDRRKLVRYLRNNLGYPAVAGLVPYGMPGYSHAAVAGYDYNPALAAKLLAEAGYAGGKGLPPITLVTQPAYQNVAEFLQNSLAEVGIRLETDLVEGAAGREMIYQGRAPFWRASWVADYPDAENFLALVYGPNAAPAGPNTTRYGNTVVDSLFASANAQSEPATRTKLFQQIENHMLRDAPVIPLFYYKTLRLYSPTVLHPHASPMDNLLDLKRMEKH